MKKCCICKSPITHKDPALLFEGKEICKTCEQKMDILTESDDIDKLKDAVNYLYTCKESVNDPAVDAYLEELIASKSEAVQKMEDEKFYRDPVNMANKRDYFAELAAGDRTTWFSILKVVAWVAFVCIILGGIILAAFSQDGESALLAFVGSVILASLLVTASMVFIGLAQDVFDIKRMLRNKDKK